MGEPIQRLSGSLRYFIVSEVQLSLSLLKCINFFPNLYSFLSGNNFPQGSLHSFIWAREGLHILIFATLLQ